MKQYRLTVVQCLSAWRLDDTAPVLEGIARLLEGIARLLEEYASLLNDLQKVTASFYKRAERGRDF